MARQGAIGGILGFAMGHAEHTRETRAGFSIGDIIGGRYRVVRVLAWGAGRWFEAEDLVLGKSVALQALARFEVSEERLTTYRGELPESPVDGTLATVGLVEESTFVMRVTEWFDGEPLSERCQRAGRLDSRWVESMVREVANTLALAHERGVFHGCLTSEQVFCATEDALERPRFKISGFGLKWLIGHNPDEAGVIDDVRALAWIATQCLSDGIEPDSASERELESAVRRMVTEAFVAASPRSQPMLEEAWSGFRLLVALSRESSQPPAVAVAKARPAPRIDEEVQVSVYRPKIVAPVRWYKLLAYTHLAAKRPDDPADDPDPVEEVQRRARAALGEAAKDYRSTTQETIQGLPEGGQITFVPEVPGIEFNPRSRSFAWLESVHEETFSLRAEPAVDGTVLRGSLSAYLGPILLAEVQLSFKVDRNAGDAAKEQEISRARAYRKVFASYSRSDGAVVRHFNDVMATLGERYLIDVSDVRSGELWSPRLEELIRQADVFQLFWSSHSMRSQFCRAEWEYALALNRERFVRPVFWESPMPRDEGSGLPPPELDRIGFATFGQPVVPPPRPSLSPRGSDSLPGSRSRPASMSEAPGARRGRRFAAAASLAVVALLVGATAMLGIGGQASIEPPGPVAVGVGPSPTFPPVESVGSLPSLPPTRMGELAELSRKLDASQDAERALEAELRNARTTGEGARIRTELAQARAQTKIARQKYKAAGGIDPVQIASPPIAKDRCTAACKTRWNECYLDCRASAGGTFAACKNRCSSERDRCIGPCQKGSPFD